VKAYRFVGVIQTDSVISISGWSTSTEGPITAVLQKYFEYIIQIELLQETSSAGYRDLIYYDRN